MRFSKRSIISSSEIITLILALAGMSFFGKSLSTLKIASRKLSKVQKHLVQRSVTVLVKTVVDRAEFYQTEPEAARLHHE